MTFQPVNSLFMVYCYWVKQFSTIYALCFTGICVAQQIAPLLNTLSTEADVHGAQKVISNNGFRMANCFCCLSQNATVCLAHCHQELQQKSWKTARLFLQDRDQDQDFMIQDKDQDFHLCPRGTSRPRPWSRGLHHWSLWHSVSYRELIFHK